MSIREIKELFCEGLNSKTVIYGGDVAENILRKAVHLSADVSDDIWSNLPKYRRPCPTLLSQSMHKS